MLYHYTRSNQTQSQARDCSCNQFHTILLIIKKSHQKIKSIPVAGKLGLFLSQREGAGEKEQDGLQLDTYRYLTAGDHDGGDHDGGDGDHNDGQW